MTHIKRITPSQRKPVENPEDAPSPAQSRMFGSLGTISRGPEPPGFQSFFPQRLPGGIAVD
jgi:hypothetical protein